MRTLVILACSKRKVNHAARAIDLYQGGLFTLGKAFAAKIKADIWIISAKYGLIPAGVYITPYEQRMTPDRVKELLADVIFYARTGDLLKRYEQIYVVAGKLYQRLLKPWWDQRFLSLVTKGIGRSLHELKELVRPGKQLILT